MICYNSCRDGDGGLWSVFPYFVVKNEVLFFFFKRGRTFFRRVAIILFGSDIHGDGDNG